MGRIKKSFNWIAGKLDELYADPAVRAEREKAKLAETPEFQEKEHKEHLEALVTAVNVGVSEGNSNLSESLKQLCDIAQEGELPDDFARKSIYDAGKNRVSNAYSSYLFPSAEHIQIIADDFAQTHQEVLGENLDTEEYLQEIHKDLLDLAEKHLALSIKDMDALITEADVGGLFADVQLRSGMDSVEQKFRQAELILSRAGLSEENAVKANTRINALYAQNILLYLKIPASRADVTEFESRANDLARALDATGARPEQKVVVMRDVALKKVDCYHTLFNRLVDLYAAGEMPISALENAVAMNNRAVEEVASALKQCSDVQGTYGPEEEAQIEALRSQYVQHIKPNSYRVEIMRLLEKLNTQDNGHPKASKKKIMRTVRTVNELIPKAELDQDQYYELRGMIKTIKRDSGYWSKSKPEQSWRKNGDHKYQDNKKFGSRMRNFSRKHRQK